MRIFFLFLILACRSFMAFSQSDTLAKYIFIPHPRSEDRVNQSVLPGIEAINFDRYDMILLGGDLTYYTSISRNSMDYCDSLFDLGNPNTLWAMGNHDISNRDLIEEYTGRPSYYSYSWNNITFLVLDVELDADGFTSSHISGDQLEMVRQVCDTILDSDYLVLIHGRLLWMIGNDYFKLKLDSVAESTRQLDTSNFYPAVYPLLQQAKNRGVPVLCLGGDKSKINIVYSPEDSITFLASTMAPEFTDAQNDVIILSHDRQNRLLNWVFVPLDEVEKNPPVTGLARVPDTPHAQLEVNYNRPLCAIEAEFKSSSPESGIIEIYSLSGQCILSAFIDPGESKIIKIQGRGVYIVRLISGDWMECQRICVE
jgi:Calcineurin-like phosphoesterase